MAADRRDTGRSPVGASLLVPGSPWDCATLPVPIGPADAPQLANGPGKPMHAANLPQMQPLIVRELIHRYAADQGIVVTANDIDNILRAQQQFMRVQRAFDVPVPTP